MVKKDELNDFDFEELDNEIGLGELLKQKENFFITLLKKMIFGILVIIIGIMVFYASFTIGKVLFLSDDTNKNIYQIEAIEDEPALIEETPKSESEYIAKTEPSNEIITEKIITKETTQPKSTEIATTKKYALIAGTFGQLSNAKTMETKVSVLGYKPEVTTFVRDNTTFYRVIAERFADMQSANKAKSILDAAGIDSFVIPL